jgi:metallo-beta-lactamase class B
MHAFRSRLLLAAAALAVVLCVGAAWTWSATRSDASKALDANDPLLLRAAITIAPGVYLLGETFPAAAYAVDTGDGLVLVDTCKEEDAAPLLRQLRTLGLDVSRLRMILLTHAHGDHVLGARSLAESTGAKVYAGRGDVSVLRVGGPHEAFFSMFEMGLSAHPTKVDVALAGGEVIELGDAKFHVLATPGHTPGSVCYLLEKNHRRILFTGDVVASLTDSAMFAGPGIYSAYLSGRFRGDAEDSIASLRTLRSMPVPDLVLPGHPRSDPTPQSARLTQDRWESLLSRSIAKLETLVARRQKDGVAFLDGAPKELLPGLRYWGEFGRCAVYGLITPSGRLFVFDAPGGAGLPEFIRGNVVAIGRPNLKPTAVLLTSSAPEAVKGLADLVVATHCAVVAPQAAIDEIRKICPPDADVRPAESLSTTDWFPVDVIPLAGRASPSVAYAIRWADKRVVLGGRAPAELTTETLAELRRSVVEPPGDVAAYLRTLDRLEKLAPDLWLPSVPVNDQNARQYDSEWSDTIDLNRAVIR